MRGRLIPVMLLSCAMLTAVPANAEDSSQAEIVGKAWRGDGDFYAAFVAYGRAEWMYRVFRNRHCAFEGNRRNSLSHVLDTTRQRLDQARLRIEALWPDGLDEVRDLFRNNDAKEVKLCDNKEAAELAFAAALMARDALDVILELIERERRS